MPEQDRIPHMPLNEFDLIRIREEEDRRQHRKDELDRLQKRWDKFGEELVKRHEEQVQAYVCPR